MSSERAQRRSGRTSLPLFRPMLTVNSTNTIRNVFFSDDMKRAERSATVVAFYSSLAGLCAELIGRAYGGGVLKLELREAKRILLPRLNLLPDGLVRKLSKMLATLDRSIRKGGSEVYESIDRLVLGEGLGLDKDSIDVLAKERVRLATRRMTRLR